MNQFSFLEMLEENVPLGNLFISKLTRLESATKKADQSMMSGWSTWMSIQERRPKNKWAVYNALTDWMWSTALSHRIRYAARYFLSVSPWEEHTLLTVHFYTKQEAVLTKHQKRQVEGRRRHQAVWWWWYCHAPNSYHLKPSPCRSLESGWSWFFSRHSSTWYVRKVSVRGVGVCRDLLVLYGLMR